ncbi:hypothetical protein L6164_016221 [Bauhinia variegata]|uniref:Uncharacterized protein n=1 Tax=Bauhinia variegata TaxID=167791 RepID=A0ACB9NNL8_BAUVA|nr:hypothetical protein L6164_016221 [Bauhinia variegata]
MLRRIEIPLLRADISRVLRFHIELHPPYYSFELFDPPPSGLELCLLADAAGLSLRDCSFFPFCCLLPKISLLLWKLSSSPGGSSIATEEFLQLSENRLSSSVLQEFFEHFNHLDFRSDNFGFLLSILGAGCWFPDYSEVLVLPRLALINLLFFNCKTCIG